MPSHDVQKIEDKRDKWGRDWETKELIPILLSYFYVGDWRVSVYFAPDLTLKLVIPEELKDQIIWRPALPVGAMSGLGCMAEKAEEDDG